MGSSSYSTVRTFSDCNQHAPLIRLAFISVRIASSSEMLTLALRSSSDVDMTRNGNGRARQGIKLCLHLAEWVRVLLYPICAVQYVHMDLLHAIYITSPTKHLGEREAQRAVVLTCKEYLLYTCYLRTCTVLYSRIRGLANGRLVSTQQFLIDLIDGIEYDVTLIYCVEVHPTCTYSMLSKVSFG